MLSLDGLIYRLPALIISLTIHELSHGLMAYKFGDPTAKNAGRLTLNPLKHLDVLGTLMILFGPFGWAKPVPFNPFYFKGDRKTKTTLVALAGPVSNLILVLISAVIYALLFLVLSEGNYLMGLLIALIQINISLMIFNLVPVPPLDGSKILAGFLPDRAVEKFYKLERYGFIILLVLIVTGALNWVLTPVFTGMYNLVFSLMNFIVSLVI